ncbi:S-methyl-5'-thioadenosine phosphorylase [Altererythrobacter sp. CAU 1778]
MVDRGWNIGIIGGSGLYSVEGLEDVQQLAVKSPFGSPSGPVTMGRIGDVRFTFLPRHGEGHAIPPHQIDYRANIDVLKRCGVSDVLAISAVGSLAEGMVPGSFVAVDQFIDRTTGRAGTFFDDGIVAHVSLADPVCARLSDLAGDAARRAGGSVHKGGTYVAIQGPQFSTRAESAMYRSWGAQVIGMTAMPEARLAREAELPYALLGMVTDYDSWREAEAGVAAGDVLKVMAENAALARATIGELAAGLPARRSASPIDRALDGAIVTAPDARSRDAMLRLDAVAGRVLLPRR